MKRIRWIGVVLLTASAAALGTVGCSSDKGDGKPAGGGSHEKAGEAKVVPTGAKEALASTGTGTLKGKVTYDGTPPEGKKDIVAPPDHKDKEYCHKGDVTDFTWKIGEGNGVANVVVWLRAPKGKYFKVPDNQQKPEEVVKIDQPFCAFEPHVVTLFPSYFDGKKQQKTGQHFEIANSAEIPHNTNWQGSDTTLISGDNKILPPKQKPLGIAVRPSKDKDAGGEQVVRIKCDIHTWMRGFAWVFDHPYAAVTDKNGNYEIKGVPAGADVEIVYWHEDVADAKPQVLKTAKLKDGDNTEDFKVKR
jgi:hypothetical protein